MKSNVKALLVIEEELDLSSYTHIDFEVVKLADLKTPIKEHYDFEILLMGEYKTIEYGIILGNNSAIFFNDHYPFPTFAFSANEQETWTEYPLSINEVYSLDSLINNECRAGMTLGELFTHLRDSFLEKIGSEKRNFNDLINDEDGGIRKEDELGKTIRFLKAALSPTDPFRGELLKDPKFKSLSNILDGAIEATQKMIKAIDHSDKKLP